MAVRPCLLDRRGRAQLSQYHTVFEGAAGAAPMRAPGYGFLSESAEFAQGRLDAGLY